LSANLRKVAGRTNTDTTRLDCSIGQRGAWAELIACSWLIEKGFRVFRNVGAHGPVDIVAEMGGRFLPVDVKLTTMDYTRARPMVTKGNSGVLTLEQEQMGVILLFVTHDGICSFDRQSINDKYLSALQKKGVDQDDDP
jgi:hypothetical protein